MSPRYGSSPPFSSQPSPPSTPPSPAPAPSPAPNVLNPIHPNAAGIDVHSDVHFVCVPADRDSQPVREFGAFSCDLDALANWLKQCGITTVALESTGVYWIPLFELLEQRGFEVYLVNARQLSNCGARPKTDVLDCQWIQRLHSYGLLRPSFRPPDSIMALRGYWRERQMLIRNAAGYVQRMQKALDQMNVKLTVVIADITGVTGTAIIEAILAGVRDPKVLAKLRNNKCRNDEETIAKALEGTWRPEHVFALKQAYEVYQFHHRQIDDCDRMIQAELGQLPDRSGDKTRAAQPRSRGRKANDVRFDACGPLFEALGVDLTEIEGIDVGTALVILAEIGVDVSKFPTEKHFASWLDLSPQQHQSNRTTKKKTRRGKNRVGIALRMAAQALGRTKSWLAQFYKRIKSRIGGRGAIKATAHKLACLVYRMLKYGREYVRKSMEEYERQMKEQAERSLQRKAAALGYELVAKPIPDAVPA